jgi:hypothetical protein
MTNDKENQMTTTYQATGRLDFPVSDLSAARQYLDEPMEEYIQYCSEDLVPVVHTIPLGPHHRAGLEGHPGDPPPPHR